MESPGLKFFLKLVGDAVHSLNTICVGLSCVEDGSCKKSEEFTIKWHSDDPVASARKSRRFAVNASLVFVEEALIRYLDFVRDCTIVDESLRKKLLSDIKLADKVRSLVNYFKFEEVFWIPIVVLLVNWRNQVVHLKSNADLYASERKLLIDNKNDIFEKHSKTDIERTLKDFDDEDISLKDISTLMSVTIKTVRSIDGQINFSITNTENLEKVIGYFDLVEEYNNILKIFDEDTKKRKFENFLKTNIYNFDNYYIQLFYDEAKYIEENNNE